MGRIAVIGATLIDGTGGEPIPESAVLVEGKRISAAGRRGEVEIPTDAETIDATGRFLLPGLVDLHIHARARGAVIPLHPEWARRPIQEPLSTG